MDDLSTQDERVMTLVAAALKFNGQERASYLHSACAADKQLYEEVIEAIEWEERMGGFLQSPAISLAGLDQPFTPGETICQRFEIVRKLGEGGMGVVYEALDRKRNQKIAIKAAKPGFGRLLSPELEGCLRVRHRNVCLVNEIHTAQTAHGDIDFLSMELLEGETLSAVLLRQGKLPAAEAQEIALQLCAGLKEAHRSGVIHRDLKSGNIILCRNAASGLRAVISDFGLSGEASQSGFFGTQRYMAPELLLGQKASQASDIFALGVILYEMMAGIKAAEESATAGTATLQASSSYQKLVADFLSLQPERRCRAFETAAQKLSPRAFSRRELVSVGIGALLATAGGAWTQRETIENWLQPLPKKRFVALLAWPLEADQYARSLVSGAIDAIESELARAESDDRNLFITSARNVRINSQEAGWLGKLGASLGVNLALQTSASQRAQGFELLLKLVDISTGAELRRHQIIFAQNNLADFSVKAVQAAAKLLDVHWDDQGVERVKPATQSAVALQAFQIAEDSRKKPNDDGLLAAVEGFKKAIDADPQYAAAYGQLAMTYQRLYAANADSGVLGLAQANAMKAIQLDRNLVSAHLALAMVHRAKGDFEAALAETRAATRLDPTNPRNLQWEGQVYLQFHRWKEAEQAFRRLQKQRPNYWVSYNELGAVLTEMGRYREAVDSFSIAAAAAPRSTLAFNNLGALHFKLGQQAQAEENYRRSLSIKPSDLAYSNLGEVLRVQGKIADAVICCKEATRLAPSKDENWLGLADCYEMTGRNEKEALESFSKAADEAQRLLDIDPSDSSLCLRLALYRMKSHAPKESWALLKKSSQLGPLDLDSEILKVRVLELGGRRKEALEMVALCLRRGPVGPQIHSVRDLRDLIKDPRYPKLSKVAASKMSATQTSA